MNFYDPNGNNAEAPILAVTTTEIDMSWAGYVATAPTGAEEDNVPGGGPKKPDPCDRSNAANAKVLNFINSNLEAALQLSQATGGVVPATYLLAWSEIESGNGQDEVATINGNYFGLKLAKNGVTGGWIGAVACSEGSYAQHACFDSVDDFYTSGYAALFSHGQRNLDRLTSAINAPNATVSSVFNAIADNAPNMKFNTNPGYGDSIQQAYDGISSRMDCK